MSPTASPLTRDASTAGAATAAGGRAGGAVAGAGDALIAFLAAGGWAFLACLACLACLGAGWLFSCGGGEGGRVPRG